MKQDRLNAVRDAIPVEWTLLNDLRKTLGWPMPSRGACVLLQAIKHLVEAGEVEEAGGWSNGPYRVRKVVASC